jgi:hypothetical protein
MKRPSSGLLAVTVLLAGGAVWSPHAAAQSGELVLASTSDEGVKANQPCYSPWLSGDGSKVAFTTRATSLDPADTDGHDDVYVKDLVTGDITLASTSDRGIKGNDDSGHTFSPDDIGSGPNSLSADGTKVAFTSLATNFDPRDRDEWSDIYVKDVVTGDITLASTSDSGIKQNGRAYDSVLSADGTKVAFTVHGATNLDTDIDILDAAYVKDLVSGDLTLASVSSTGVKMWGRVAAVSANGQRVLLNGLSGGVYVKNLKTGTLRLVSTSDSGVKANSTSYGVSLIHGEASFYSYATNLDPADTEEDQDAYVKDLATGDVSLVSTTLAPPPDRPGDDPGGALSADGTKAVFDSYANVTLSDMDNNRDVWVRDLTTGTAELVSVGEIGRSNRGSYGGTFAGEISADGSRVAFISLAFNLDPADTDSLFDIYVKTIA